MRKEKVSGSEKITSWCKLENCVMFLISQNKSEIIKSLFEWNIEDLVKYLSWFKRLGLSRAFRILFSQMKQRLWGVSVFTFLPVLVQLQFLWLINTSQTVLGLKSCLVWGFWKFFSIGNKIFEKLKKYTGAHMWKTPSSVWNWQYKGWQSWRKRKLFFEKDFWCEPAGRTRVRGERGEREKCKEGKKEKTTLKRSWRVQVNVKKREKREVDKLQCPVCSCAVSLGVACHGLSGNNWPERRGKAEK